MPITDETPPERIMAMTNMRFIIRNKDNGYYQTELCREMSAEYGPIYTEITLIEDQICDSLLDNLRDKLADIQHMCKLCGRLDAFMSMATFALAQHLRKPEMCENEKTLQIHNGRHILIKRSVSNDTSVSVDQRNLITVLIAPNASGKSVYLKQVAQIVYLAHVGSFVPAENARMSVFDAVYTRIYCPEAVSQGKSAFMIELQQMAYLLMNSSTNSLVLIDEFGQGTVARDGRALVQSALEHLNGRAELAPMTILSTHFTNIYDALAHCEWIRFKTFHVNTDDQGTLISTYSLSNDRAPANYGRKGKDVVTFLHRTTDPIDGPNGM